MIRTDNKIKNIRRERKKLIYAKKKDVNPDKGDLADIFYWFAVYLTFYIQRKGNRDLFLFNSTVFPIQKYIAHVT